jgi:hypothetical protein
MELDALAPEVSLPTERPLYAPRTEVLLDDAVEGGDTEAVDLTGLVDQVYVDTARLADQVRELLRGREQVRLREVLSVHPPSLGLAEILSYLALSEDDLEVVIDDSEELVIRYHDVDDHPRQVRMPQVTLTRSGVR